jgi:hypothetical protein
MLKHVVFLLLLLGLLAACRAGSPRRVLYIFDGATLEWLKDSQSELLRQARRHGYMPSVVVITEPQTADSFLRQTLRERQPELVLLLTPAPLNAAGLSLELPEARFVRFFDSGGGEEEQADSRWVQVVFDRREAFRQAGEAAGRLLASTAGVAVEAGRKAAVLLHEPSAEGVREIEAFRAGFSASVDISRLVLKEIRHPEDTEGIRAAMEGLRAQGVSIYLLKAYRANGVCLEILAEGGGMAILEDWQAAGGWRDAVLLSIEADLLAAVRQALSGARAGGPLPGRLEGPVRLQRGGAMPRTDLSALGAPTAPAGPPAPMPSAERIFTQSAE